MTVCSQSDSFDLIRPSIHHSVHLPVCSEARPSTSLSTSLLSIYVHVFYLSVHPSSCSSIIHAQTMVHLHVSPTISYILAPVNSLIYPLIHALSVFCQSFCMYVRLSIFLSFSQLCICWTGCWFIYMSRYA